MVCSYTKPLHSKAFFGVSCLCAVLCAGLCFSSGLYRSAEIRCGKGRGGEADPDIPRVESLENPICNNIREAWKTGVLVQKKFGKEKMTHLFWLPCRVRVLEIGMLKAANSFLPDKPVDR